MWYGTLLVSAFAGGVKGRWKALGRGRGTGYGVTYRGRLHSMATRSTSAIRLGAACGEARIGTGSLWRTVRQGGRSRPNLSVRKPASSTSTKYQRVVCGSVQYQCRTALSTAMNAATMAHVMSTPKRKLGRRGNGIGCASLPPGCARPWYHSGLVSLVRPLRWQAPPLAASRTARAAGSPPRLCPARSRVVG